MTQVLLREDWTDDQGVTHLAGETVEVDDATLLDLQARNLVDRDKSEWLGPTSEPKDPNA